jgi:ABC-2 type transport system permease protein
MVDNMKKNLKIFWLFATYSITITFRHPTGVALFTLGKIIRFGMFFLFVFYLLSNTKILAGYTMNQSIIFYLTYNIIDSLAQLLFREVYRFRQLVVSGELDTILVRPYHPFLRILLGGVDVLDAVISMIYFLMTLYFLTKIPNVTLLHFGLYILLILNSLIIATGFHIAVLALGVLSTEVDHTIMIYRDISKMGTFPIDIYQQPIRFLFTFVLPIGIMMSFPVKGLFNLLSPTMYLTSFIFAMSTFFGALWLWDFALKKYQSWGG